VRRINGVWFVRSKNIEFVGEKFHDKILGVAIVQNPEIHQPHSNAHPLCRAKASSTNSGQKIPILLLVLDSCK